MSENQFKLLKKRASCANLYLHKGKQALRKCAKKIININKYLAKLQNKHVDSAEIKEIKAKKQVGNIDTKIERHQPERKIAIVTAITAGYDKIVADTYQSRLFDYYLFSDQKIEYFGKNVGMDYYDECPVRRARYIKMHPHMYFDKYDIVIWRDGNVSIRENIQQLIEEFIETDQMVASFLHPWNTNPFEEGLQCIREGKDRKKIILKQLEKYKNHNFRRNSLIESNFLIYNMNNPKLRGFLAKWWHEIENGSFRDQLSFNYVIDQVGEDFFALGPKGISVRNSNFFCFQETHLNNQRNINQENSAQSRYLYNIKDQQKNETDEKRRTDIIVCVHNALEDVKKCIRSLRDADHSSVDRIIIIDDKSDKETRDFLKNLTKSWSKVEVFINNEQLGYTKSVNKGIKISNAESVILLNSDTVISKKTVKKLLNCLFSSPYCGIVGPLSNAAGFQSIPSIKSKGLQTAINILPHDLTCDQIDLWCEKQAVDFPYPSVPLIHGFCMAIRKEVFNEIGYFDEVLFPNGYGEENDFCIRAFEAGFTLRVSLDAYVYHSKSKSYTDDNRRKKLVKLGNLNLGKKFGKDRMVRYINSCKNNPILNIYRARSSEAFRRSLS